ncbi:class I SAM-dependent methyltransferase [Amycolatopsis sp. K13G38]|uniref:Class I SAM-dependent methyltransferase n=1 Tax=Amycolatopsis acididurans TaxID=2724524 RepID=A0ABX1J6A9_9PSEU|nr:class I SAM-dependent methyltransferase [Amycolatopsis acididurans]NKQ54459.1 class I SAM-dependent methyltransferase [Amycolatopsis acididurans]
MTHDFGKTYWEQHWDQAAVHDVAANPYLARETGHLRPGTALDAGCGRGAEARWLAAHGWRVTAVDISAAALAKAAGRTAEQITWIEADLTEWTPTERFDLVTTSYAHPAMPQLAFYRRIADWVAPGGTLLIVGHLHEAGHGHHPPPEATVTAEGITAGLDAATWEIDTAGQHTRPVGGRSLHDVVVRATRRGVPR